MKYHMDTHSLISVANYLGFLEGTGRIEIDEEDQLYGIMEQIDEDVNKSAICAYLPSFCRSVRIAASL